MSSTSEAVRPDPVVPTGHSNGKPTTVDSAGWIVVALEAVLTARAPGLHASTPLVRQLAGRLGRELGLDSASLALLDVSARVRDIGMVGIADTVVLSIRPLAPADWKLVNRHPMLGAELLSGLAPVADAAPIVQAHHERWDGDGYPDGLSGDAIPLLSRVIAVCDAFVAMASDRPYRRGIGTEAALEHVRLAGGSQLDPQVTGTFVTMLAGVGEAVSVVGPDAAGTTVDARRGGGRQAERDGGLAAAVSEFDVVPVFAPAYDEVLAALGSSGVAEIVAAIEGDTGLTVAVLRAAQAAAGRRRVTNVADAVDALSHEQMQRAIGGLPRVAFPWRTTPLELLLHRSRIHAQAVARAAERIFREVTSRQSDDVVAAALLHDVGKLVLSRIGAMYEGTMDIRTATPEERAREERRALGVDHASIGALLIRRWGMPSSLARAVKDHHSSDDGEEIATYVRLADMLAHHAQGDTVDRTVMLRAAHACELSTGALRDVMFDLPHSGGSRRYRAEHSPLSIRETDVLTRLAERKVYKLIAVDMDVAVSTIRTHVHTIYAKLGVTDRAHAVLRATEMGWI